MCHAWAYFNTCEHDSTLCLILIRIWPCSKSDEANGVRGQWSAAMVSASPAYVKQRWQEACERGYDTAGLLARAMKRKPRQVHAPCEHHPSMHACPSMQTYMVIALGELALQLAALEVSQAFLQLIQLGLLLGTCARVEALGRLRGKGGDQCMSRRRSSLRRVCNRLPDNSSALTSLSRRSRLRIWYFTL